MIDNPSINKKMSRNIRLLLQQAWLSARFNPQVAKFVLQTIHRQVKSSKIRDQMESKGIHVPPFLIMSITNQCNLKCRGCYSAAQHRPAQGEIEVVTARSILAEARELGVSFVLLAGGEPMVRPEIISLAGEFSEVIFPIFTNGLLIDEPMLTLLSRSRNLVPVISLEGDRNTTDSRRGDGVYGRVTATMNEMRDRGIFFGTSITVTRQNLDSVTDKGYLENLMRFGCKVFFYVEYVPADGESDELVPVQEQRDKLHSVIEALRRELTALFISFPGDEEDVGGCLAAGRGFLHISARGDVEPCPFTPWSDTSLKVTSLRKALDSPLLTAIREHHEELQETTGGCALWNRRDWVQSLLTPSQKD